ncbi:glycosyltransferase family 4 protein [Altererythrobacter sp. Root672]|uniref:glycosyltransferase family 4 protein n=1 Tax=Altererythrobacter sp. Root672 TaxID=1736584 RepID=UPI0006FDCE1D|nr:glycosyltransferase family 4 protein [Altererythrobacter sp. Root672]KRA82881.1 glycosyl transferase family 1 [Altererythrobacter sp. Root672]
MSVPRILHLHSSFDAGGKELRCVQLINAFGRDAEHAIVSGDPERRSAAERLSGAAKVSWPEFPSLKGKPLPGRLKRLAAAMAGYDLICTYNWGAMDAVMAHTLFADPYKLAPLVHHEDGFNEDEAGGLKPLRNFYRGIALGRSSALVVPSRTLERIALETWHQPRTRVRLIPNGIDTRAFTLPPKRDALPRVVKRKGELWVGTLTGLRVVKNLPQLVRAFRNLPEEWQLVIGGEGPERGAILAQAATSGIEDRVHLPGQVVPAKAAALFDIFALSSLSEQFPISVVEAMAAGLPIAAPRVGDIAAMVATDNGPYLSAPGDEAGLAAAIAALAADPALRKRIGEANRAKAKAEYDEGRMIERYRALYWGLMNRIGVTR